MADGLTITREDIAPDDSGNFDAAMKTEFPVLTEKAAPDLLPETPQPVDLPTGMEPGDFIDLAMPVPEREEPPEPLEPPPPLDHEALGAPWLQKAPFSVSRLLRGGWEDNKARISEAFTALRAHANVVMNPDNGLNESAPILGDIATGVSSWIASPGEMLELQQVEVPRRMAITGESYEDAYSALMLERKREAYRDSSRWFKTLEEIFSHEMPDKFKQPIGDLEAGIRGVLGSAIPMGMTMVFGPGVGFVANYATMQGGMQQRAEDMGLTTGEAFARTAVPGIVSAGLETISDRFQLGLVRNLIGKTGTGLGARLLRAGFDFGKAAGTEYLTEAAQQAPDFMAMLLAANPDASATQIFDLLVEKRFDLLAEMHQAGYLGAIGGAFLHGAGRGVAMGINTVQGRRMVNEYDHILEADPDLTSRLGVLNQGLSKPDFIAWVLDRSRTAEDMRKAKNTEAFPPEWYIHPRQQEINAQRFEQEERRRELLTEMERQAEDEAATAVIENIEGARAKYEEGARVRDNVRASLINRFGEDQGEQQVSIFDAAMRSLADYEGITTEEAYAQVLTGAEYVSEFSPKTMLPGPKEWTGGEAKTLYQDAPEEAKRTAREEIKRILTHIGEKGEDGVSFGLRVVPEGMNRPKPGDVLDPSYPWEDGEHIEGTDPLLGTSTIGIKADGLLEDVRDEDIDRALSLVGAYWGDTLALVRSEHGAELGQDVGEYVLKDAEVVSVFDLPRLSGQAGWRQRAHQGEIADTLYQTPPDESAPTGEPQKQPMGQVDFMAETGQAIVKWFQTADATTPPHELGHILRRVLQARGDADYYTIADWCGKADANHETDAWSEAEEEQFAKGFERYMAEGRAPTPLLKKAFQKIKEMIIAVYEQIDRVGVPINDDVRAVFDRLLSTEEEQNNKLFRDDPYQRGFEYEGGEVDVSGLTIEDFTEYDQVAAKARALAEEKREKERAKERGEAGARKEAIQQWNDLPIIRAAREAQRVGINRDDLLYQTDIHTVRALNKRWPRIVRKNGKLPIDMMLDASGYRQIHTDAHTDKFIEDLIDAPEKDVFVNDYVRQLIQHDIEYQQEDPEYAEKDITRLLELEEKILAQLLKGSTQKTKNIPWKRIKKIIREKTGMARASNLVREDHALNYAYRRAARAARDAFEAGTRETRQGERDKYRAKALKQKQKQRAIAEQIRARREAKRTVNRIIRDINRAKKAKNIHPDYKTQIDQLLSKFEFRGRSAKTQRKLDSLRVFLEERKAAGEVLEIPQAHLDRLDMIPIRNLSLEDLQEVGDMVSRLAHLGKLKNKLISQKNKRVFEATMDAVVKQIYSRATMGHKTTDGMADTFGLAGYRVGAFDKLKGPVERMHAYLLKPGFILKDLDGFQDFGPVQDAIYMPIKRAEDAEFRMKEDARKKMKAIQDKVNWQAWADEKIESIPGVRDEILHSRIRGEDVYFTKEKAVMVALNSGNEGNRAALRQGYSMTDAEIDAIVKSLSPEEMNFVRETWAFLDTFFKDLDRVHRSMTGLSLKKVDGNYFPLVFDYMLSRRAGDLRERELMMLGMSNYVNRPATRHGSRHERKGGKMPPLLRLDVITRHVDEVVHDTTHAEAIRDVSRVIYDNQFRTAIESTKGEAYFRQLRPWLENIAKPWAEGQTDLDRTAGFFRRNSTAMILGFKVSVAAKQFLSYTQTINEIGVEYAIKGIDLFYNSGEYGKTIQERVEFVHARSPAVQGRALGGDRDLKYSFEQFTKTGRIRGDMAKAAYGMIRLMDKAAVYPTWLGAYAKGMEVNGWDEQKAVDYADRVVEETQPTTAPKAMAAVQRGGAFQRSFVMFYSHFSNVYNLISREASMARAGVSSPLDMFNAFAWLIFIPAMLSQVISKRELPDEKDFILEPIGYTLGAVPLVRDAWGAARFYGRSITSPWMSMIVQGPGRFGYGLVDAATGGDVSFKNDFLYPGIRTIGLFTGLPSEQALVTMEGALDLAAGETNNPLRLLMR